MCTSIKRSFLSLCFIGIVAMASCMPPNTYSLKKFESTKRDAEQGAM